MSKRQKIVHVAGDDESPVALSDGSPTAVTGSTSVHHDEDALPSYTPPTLLILPTELQLYCLSFLTVETLETQTSLVSNDWKQKSEEAIARKLTNPKPFETGEELKEEVRVYTKCKYTSEPYDSKVGEEIARTRGWPINKWEVSRVEDFSRVFEDQFQFNGSISAWNVSNARRMDGMFRNARSFNRDIGDWNTVNVTDMSYMFYSAALFNGDIGGWNTANVTNMRYMFDSAALFNGDVGGWNTANVTDMRGMFHNARSFNGDIGGWNTANVTSMNWMFGSAALFNGDIGGWNTANVTDMRGMFHIARSFNGDISRWNMENVGYYTENMFGGATSLDVSKRPRFPF